MELVVVTRGDVIVRTANLRAPRVVHSEVVVGDVAVSGVIHIPEDGAEVDTDLVKVERPGPRAILKDFRVVRYCSRPPHPRWVTPGRQDAEVRTEVLRGQAAVSVSTQLPSISARETSARSSTIPE